MQLAVTNNYLAQSNKTRTGVKATNKLPKPVQPNGTNEMKTLTLWASILLAIMTTTANAATKNVEPTPEMVKEYAFDYMRQFPKDFSDRQIANQLASSIYWMEKLQTICPSYFYVNAANVRFIYLLSQGTWSMMFGPGRTSTQILNETNRRRNQEFNNAVNKKAWCESIKQFGIKTLDWEPFFQADE